MKLIAVCSELNFIFRRQGLGLDKGILFLLDEDIPSSMFIQIIQNTIETVEVGKLRKKQREVLNYQLAVYKYDRCDKTEALQEFLDNTKFLSAVIIGDIVPEVLKDSAYILKISGTLCSDMCRLEFREEMDAMREFIRSNPEIIVRELNLLKTSKEFEQSQHCSQLFVSLLAAMRVYCAFCRNKHSEANVEVLKARIFAEIGYYVRAAEEMAEAYDAMEAVKAVALKFFTEEKDYKIAEISQVDGNMVKAVEEEKAVLYDSEFYYISEPLFRKACKSLLSVLSFIEIKRMLRDEGFLHCYQTENTNFTTKKVFINVYGAPCRGRFLKMEKEFFCSPEGLNLEEGRES